MWQLFYRLRQAANNAAASFGDDDSSDGERDETAEEKGIGFQSANITDFK